MSSIVDRSDCAIAVLLDIRNAFNGIPWRVVRKVLGRKSFPPYIRRIIDAYLSDRVIRYVGRDSKQHSRAMEAGILQGSVLRPIL